MKKIFFGSVTIFFASIIILCSCSKSSNSVRTTDLPAVYKKIYGATNMYAEGDVLVIQCKGLPDHKSPYYEDTKDSAMYEAYNGENPGFMLAMGKIEAMNYTFTIPLHPKEAEHKQATQLGPIGIAVNGVPFFNQYNGMGQALTTEINTFDQYNGHPTPDNAYHYHAEPYYLTTNKGKDALLGFLLDGFPVYGPVENGKVISNDSLDNYHGHFGVTADYPNGIYHYHITSTDPYINGDGYYGEPGTVSF